MGVADKLPVLLSSSEIQAYVRDMCPLLGECFLLRNSGLRQRYVSSAGRMFPSTPSWPCPAMTHVYIFIGYIYKYVQ